MAEEPPAEAAGHLPAFDFQAGAGIFHVRLRIDSPWLAAGLLGGGTLTLGAFYISNREYVETAITIALAGLADRILNIRSSSILVEFVCYTKGRFLAFMDAFATGTVKQRLQEELSKIGYGDELEVTITVEDPESEMRKEEEERTSDFKTASDFSDSSRAESMESEDMSSSQSPATAALQLGKLKKIQPLGSTAAYPESSEELMKVAAFPPSVKVGTPTDDELERLADDIRSEWEKLGRCLGFTELELDEINTQWRELSQKGYHMLRQWRNKLGTDASYNVLNDALRHRSVQRQDLAKMFCHGEDIMEL